MNTQVTQVTVRITCSTAAERAKAKKERMETGLVARIDAKAACKRDRLAARAERKARVAAMQAAA